MMVEKTIVCRILGLTGRKEGLVVKEYSNAQGYIRGEVGDLSGVQNQDKGREMNRKLHRFPHYSFRQMLEYKCRERGVEYIEINEAYTSKRCSCCGEEGNRNGGEFKCPNCCLDIDADVNGARNIVSRALGKSEIRPLVNAGAPVAVPGTLSVEATSGPSPEAITC